MCVIERFCERVTEVVVCEREGEREVVCVCDREVVCVRERGCCCVV